MEKAISVNGCQFTVFGSSTKRVKIIPEAFFGNNFHSLIALFCIRLEKYTNRRNNHNSLFIPVFQ